MIRTGMQIKESISRTLALREDNISPIFPSKLVACPGLRLFFSQIYVFLTPGVTTIPNPTCPSYSTHDNYLSSLLGLASEMHFRSFSCGILTQERQCLVSQSFFLLHESINTYAHVYTQEMAEEGERKIR